MSDRDQPQPKNQQFTLLNTFRRERALVDVYLVSGVRLRGRIRSFDQYSMVIDTGQGEAFLYHHAVSSVSPALQRGAGKRPSAPRRDDMRRDDGHREDARRHDFPPDEDEPPPMRRTPGTAKPPEVTVVRRPSRRITLPPEARDPNAGSDKGPE